MPYCVEDLVNSWSILAQSYTQKCLESIEEALRSNPNYMITLVGTQITKTNRVKKVETIFYCRCCFAHAKLVKEVEHESYCLYK